MDGIFILPSARRRHEEAPLWHEREVYLAHLLQQGVSRENVRSTASTLIHVIRLLELSRMRAVGVSEIGEAGKRWASDHCARLTRKPGKKSFEVFSRIARGWLGFHGQLRQAPSIVGPFTSLLNDFSMELESRGLRPDTVNGYCRRSRAFLDWLSGRVNSISAVSPKDIDDYLKARRAEGWCLTTVATVCQALRSLFGYAELRGFSVHNPARVIHGRAIVKSRSSLEGPSWRQIRRAIRSTSGNNPSEMQALAVILLCSIYALRTSEIIRLHLDDLDWRNETITVRRAKWGRVQQFPIQYEVGEAILRYLRVRPHCRCQNVFVTRRPPYGPVPRSTMSSVVSDRMRELGIQAGCLGPLGLRHGCATRLMKAGFSLREIAAFLGHSNMRSVGIYAKLDLSLLSKVSAFSLAWTR